MSLNSVIEELQSKVGYIKEFPDQVRENIPRLRELMGLLDYYTTPRTRYQQGEKSDIHHVQCMHEGCVVTSKDPDSCVLNFAAKGSAPLWLCRQHHIKRDIIPTGWRPTEAELASAAKARKAAMGKLSAYERSLINRNIVR